MATPSFRIYDALKPTLGELTTKEFIEALDESIVAKIEIMKNDLATKGDIAEVKGEIVALRLSTKDDIAEVKGEIVALRLSTKDDIGALKEEIAKCRNENIKYTFIAGAVQVILIIGALLAIIRASK